MDFDNTPSNFRQDLLNAYYNSRFERFFPETKRISKKETDDKETEFKNYFDIIPYYATADTFKVADELRSDIDAASREKRTEEKDPYFEDQRNINAFLTNLEKAVEIRLETRMMEARDMGGVVRFATITAVEITYIDGNGKARRTGRGTRIEAISHFRELWNNLGGSDTEIVTSITRAGDSEFDRYKATISGYFGKWLDFKRIDEGSSRWFNNFAALVKPIAKYIKKEIKVFSPGFVQRFPTAVEDALREEACEEILSLYNLNGKISAKRIARAIWNP